MPYPQLMTEEERRKQEAAAAILGGRMSPGMVKGSRSPAEMAAIRAQAGQDLSGKEAALAQQLRGGRAMMMQQGPQGKQMGKVYVGPTWSEALNSAVQKGMGAYDMAQARAGQRGLEGARQVKSDAAGILAQQEAEAATTQQTLENEQRQAGIEQAAANAAARKAEAEETRARYERQREDTLQYRADMSEERRKDNERADKKLADMEEKRINTEKRRLSDKITSEGVTEARTKLNRFFEVIEPFADKDEAGAPTGGYSAVPGIGGVNNSQMMGGAWTFAEDSWDDMKRAAGGALGKVPKGESGAGADARAAYTDVLNQKVKDISGGAVPIAEWIRNQAAAGYSVWNDEMDAIDGMKEIKRALDAKEANIFKGYEDEVVARYREKDGPTATGKPPGISDEDWEEYLRLGGT